MRFGLFLLGFIVANNLFAQKNYYLSLEGGNTWHTADFYLNYKAVPNDDLRATYADGAEDNEVEHYRFSTMPSFVARFHYEISDPRKRKSTLVYSVGLGYSETKFVVTDAGTVFSIPLGYALTGGQPRDYRYSFNYLIIPLGVSKYFKKPGKVFFYSIGTELTNYFLVGKKGEVKFEGNASYQPNNDGRLASSRDFLLMLNLNPSIGVALGREQKFRIAANVKGGISFLNVLRKEEALFKQYTYSEQDGIEMYEKTKSLNPFCGFGVSMAYQLN
ncbi:hypothetical protein [Owenweeksia hongkongensis]|uniref:hypothetical protein n=1 Tax=Owenweeksia hongkongensis TaxID=253245 RepID=UPI003A949DDA